MPQLCQNSTAKMRQLIFPENYRYAVEGRHASWFDDDSYQFLSENDLCLVWNEVEGVANPAKITTDFVYLRLIGDRSIPENEFGKIQRQNGFSKKMGLKT